MSGQNATNMDSLCQRIEAAFKDVVGKELKGIIPQRASLNVSPKYDGFHPVLTLLIQDSGIKTAVEIPVGLANPEFNSFFAGINGSGYRRYKSPEDIGYDAAKVFKHDYTVEIRGI